MGSDSTSTYDPFEDLLDVDAGAKARSLALFPFTDYGNAERLVQMHGDEMLWVPSWKQWLIWDGRRWRVDDDEQHVRWAKDTVRSLYAAAGEIDDVDQRQKLSGWARTSENAKRLKEMVNLATSELSMSVQPHQLDSHPRLLNLENGTLDLGTGELLEHDRDHLITKVLSVAYDPDASAPRWERFLSEVLPDDEERAFLQRAVGYSLTGLTVEEVMFILLGPGSNGKSVLLETLRAVFGGFSQNAPTGLLMQRTFESIPADLARLPGARFVTVIESERGQRLAEGTIKSLTSGDRITARGLYQSPFEFTPACKIWLATNHLPQIKGDDDGIWRRIMLLNFTQRITGGRRDKHLRTKLAAEREGVLRWAVEGCRLWRKYGLNPPASVTKAVGDYRQDMDVFGQFLTEATVEASDGFITTTELFSLYQMWCSANGIKFEMTKPTVGKLMKERGYKDTRRQHQVLKDKKVTTKYLRGFAGINAREGA